MLENLALFVAIADRGSLAAAGRDQGMSPATVSARLAALEQHYGARLLHRTTRSSSPTPEGEAVLEGARRILAEVGELDARVRQGARHLSGRVRVSAPMDIGRNWLVPRIDELLAEHPALEVEVRLSDRYVDLVGDGYDLALRFGTLADSSLRARKMADVHRVVCASPSYVERFGAPEHPRALSEHACLVMRFGNGVDDNWSFHDAGQLLKVQVRGRRLANDSDLVRRWCIQGHGIAYKANVDIAADLQAGRLVGLLETYRGPSTELQLVYPGARPPRRVRAVLDYLIASQSSIAAPRPA